jgi:hypothetical protein
LLVQVANCLVDQPDDPLHLQVIDLLRPVLRGVESGCSPV